MKLQWQKTQGEHRWEAVDNNSTQYIIRATHDAFGECYRLTINGEHRATSRSLRGAKQNADVLKEKEKSHG